MTKFKVGDEVYSKEYGVGMVEDTGDAPVRIYPIVVRFSEGRQFSFTAEGKRYRDASYSPEIRVLQDPVDLKEGDEVYSKTNGLGVIKEVYPEPYLNGRLIALIVYTDTQVRTNVTLPLSKDMKYSFKVLKDLVEPLKFEVGQILIDPEEPDDEWVVETVDGIISSKDDKDDLRRVDPTTTTLVPKPPVQEHTCWAVWLKGQSDMPILVNNGVFLKTEAEARAYIEDREPLIGAMNPFISKIEWEE